MSEAQKTVPGGRGPAFEVTDLPEPVRDLTAEKELFAILGPAVIALGGTIGGGEWLIGPSLFVKWGLAAPLGHHRVVHSSSVPQSRDVPVHPLHRRADHRRVYEAGAGKVILGLAFYGHWIL